MEFMGKCACGVNMARELPRNCYSNNNSNNSGKFGAINFCGL